jgi:hypothetical protein
MSRFDSVPQCAFGQKHSSLKVPAFGVCDGLRGEVVLEMLKQVSEGEKLRTVCRGQLCAPSFLTASQSQGCDALADPTIQISEQICFVE